MSTIRIPVPKELDAAIETYLETNNIAKRGLYDGSRRKQHIGLIGECVAHHHFTGEYPDLAARPRGFDGGYDFVYRGHRIDVKTMERKCYVKPDYVNNFPSLQMHYESDILLFCSYHRFQRVVEICGWVTKEEFRDRANLFTTGTDRKRDNDSSFTLVVDNYEIKNENLNNVDLLTEIAVLT